jgi:phospholipid/cholesterol/gamma-HCH transport system substrate-binding protein
VTSRRLAALATTMVLAAATTSACDFDGAYDLPLPGGPVDTDEAFTVTAEFADVLNVVPRSPVMVADVPVGEVLDVERDGWRAEVTLAVRDDIELPDNATAEIRQTSLLGEKYVALVEPEKGSVGRLGDGDRIPMGATGRNPEVEEVLGALSFLLSGGGVSQIRTISTELNKVMSGRTDTLRHLLGELDSLVGTLDQQKGDIIHAMESVNRLTRTLNQEEETVEAALDATGPALRVLNRQHRSLMTMLRQLDELGRVGTRVINGTKENLLADLDHLQPILRKLNEAGDSLPRGLSLLISFPFPEEAAEIAKGDYANASFGLEVSLESLLQGAPDDGDGPLPQLPGLELPGLQGSGVGKGGGLLQGGLG